MTQPEPLRLADALEKWAKDYASTEYWDEMGVESATELRRLYEENKRLKLELVKQVKYSLIVWDREIVEIAKATGESK